jgi:hypothetical protein
MAQKKAAKKPGPKPKESVEATKAVEMDVPQGTSKAKAPKAKGKDYKKVMEGILAKIKDRPHTRRDIINLIQTELNA